MGDQIHFHKPGTLRPRRGESILLSAEPVFLAPRYCEWVKGVSGERTIVDQLRRCRTGIIVRCHFVASGFMPDERNVAHKV